MSNLKSIILEADDCPSEEVNVLEWGNVKLKLVGLTGEGRADYLSAGLDDNGDRKPDWLKYSTPRLLIEGIVDPSTGERVFTIEDIDALNRKSSQVLDRLAKTIARLSGLGADEQAKKEAEATEIQFRGED